MRNWMWIFCLILAVVTSSALSQELESAENCAECHAQSVADWKTSRHALSTPETNPFYAAMLDWANESTNGGAQEKCDQCHVPVKYLATTNQVVEHLAQEGVTCDVCHATQPDGEWMKLGSAGVKYGPYNDAISVVHESEYSKHLISSDHCLTCHANLESAHGFAFCSTLQEYRASSFNKMNVTCQDCHMPAIQGKTAELGKIRDIHSHKFYGGYNPEILRDCASLDLDVKSDTSKISVAIRITNRTVGHALPTGSPMRAVYLSLKALDSDGNVVWQNYTANPLLEDPSAVFMRLLENAEGQAPVPPWLATNVKFDQRLKPDETRQLDYNFPNHNVTAVIANLNYRLAPPALLSKLNLNKEPYSNVITISSETYSIK